MIQGPNFKPGGSTKRNLLFHHSDNDPYCRETNCQRITIKYSTDKYQI